MKKILEIFIFALLAMPLIVSAQLIKANPQKLRTFKAPNYKPKHYSPEHMPDKRQTKPLVLTLKDAVNLAISKNPNVKTAELQRVTEKYALVVAKWQFHPHWGLTGNATYDGNQGRLTQIDIAPTVSLQTVYGTTLSFQAGNTVSGLRYDPRLIFNITQPLIRGFGRDVVEATLRNALDSEEINKLNLKNTVMTTVLQVIRDYLTLVQSNYTLQNNRSSLSDLEKNLYETQKLIEAGRKAKTDILRPQAEIAQKKVDIQNNVNNIHQNTLRLLDDTGLDLSTNIVLPQKIDFNALIKRSLGGRSKLASLSYYKRLTLQNDIGYQTQGITLRTLKRSLLVSKNNQLWQLDLSANKTFIPGAAPNLDARSNDIFKSTIFNLNLSVPIDDKNLKSELLNAQVSLDTAFINYRELRRQLEISTENNLNNVLSDKENLELTQLSLTLQRQNYAAQRIRYNAGIISNFELLSDQRNLVTAEQSVIDSEITYLSDLVDFDQSVGTILDHWGITIIY